MIFRPHIPMLMLACALTSQATTITFFAQAVFTWNVPVDKYRDQGVIMGSSSATSSDMGLCIGDIPLPPPLFQARQLVSCTAGTFGAGTSTLTFTFVEPKHLHPNPTDSFVMTVTFRPYTIASAEEPWKASAFDKHHNLLETREGTTAPVHTYYPRAETITFLRQHADIASVEFIAPGVSTATSIQWIHFD